MTTKKLILISTIKRYFNDKIWFDVLQDKLIDYAESLGINHYTQKLYKVYDKLCYYYLYLQKKEERTEEQEEKYINKALNLLK